MAPQYDGLTKREVEILLLLAEGLSDREIAERLVMTINTVKWYNRQIYRILGVRSRTQAISRARELHVIHDDHGAARFSSAGYRTPKQLLPVETTHFIGRTRELEAIKRLLGAAHLLTLVGPPGTGKTRLALQVASEVADTYREGVYLVSLAPVSDPALVTQAIACAIGVAEVHDQPVSETLKYALRERQLLLLVDNVEHVLSAAPQVAALLSAAPHLTVLATSREPLHLYGEQEYAVPPLELPDPEQFDPEQFDPQQLDPQALAECESVALFVQQARAVRSDFALTAENAADVANICVRLDGLPLALELAAARIKLLTPRTLLARLKRRLDTLTGGAQDLPVRQQTLQNTIAWSYDLLNEGEKTLFARLAVFRGGCSLEAMEAVCSEGLPIDVFDGLASLVDKSLIQQKETPHGEPRFLMLETILEFAGERLVESAQADTIRRRHAEYFVRLAERADPELRQAQHRYWFRLLETEHDNMRAILEWSLGEGESALGVRLAGALGLFWYAYGYHTEGQQWTQRLLDRLDTVSTEYHARLLVTAGRMAYLYDLDASQRYFDRALQISRALGDRVNIAWSLIYMGYVMMREGDAALAIAEEGLSLFRDMNHKPGIAQALNIIGEIAAFKGDDKRARQAYEECLAVSQETGETRRIRYMFGNLTFLAQHEGEYERARALAEQGLRLALEMDIQLDIADSLAGLAGVMGATGQPEQAARLLGAWEATLERLGAVPQPADKPKQDRNIAAVRAQLPPTTFEATWLEGRAMSLEQAVASVLERGDGSDLRE